jgi:hypothetical protein
MIIQRLFNPFHAELPTTTKADDFFDCYATVPKMSFCTLFPSTHSIQAPLQESIKSLVGIICIDLPRAPYKGLELSKELLNRV